MFLKNRAIINFEIITHLNQENLLNKKSELISKCRDENKYLLKNYKNK